MELWIIRHAVAEERSAGASDADDAARPLTRRGRRRFRREVRGLRALGVTLDGVLCSPRRRATETAKLLRPLVDDGARVRVTGELDRAPRAEILSSLAALGAARAALVGHEPYLSALIATLALGDPRHGDAFALRKGGVAHLTGDAIPGGMHLCALWPPRALRRTR